MDRLDGGNFATWLCVAIFMAAYALVVLEERLRLRKSIPAMLGASGIWLVASLAAAGRGESSLAAAALLHNLLEYGQLMLFLLVAMTFVNTLEERGVFAALRSSLARRRLSLRQTFWITGGLAFCVSPVADNLTTALILGTVALAVGGDRPQFVVVACINVVVAANAGGAFSPFGDITTLMVWQAGVVKFQEFFALAVPALVAWLVPAVIMSVSVPRDRPTSAAGNQVVRPAGLAVVGLLLGTIAGTVTLHSFLGLPPVFGMMTGLAVLKLYGHLLRRRFDQEGANAARPARELGRDDSIADLGFAGAAPVTDPADRLATGTSPPFDVFRQLERAEWDTLLFFYGVVMSVGGLAALGALDRSSTVLYGGLGPTWSNVLLGLASAVVDNVPITFAVLNVRPEMSLGQWLLVTLTVGVGGSLLSVGSAAGVALMGQARGIYTFRRHLRWTWAIALGFVASIAVHLLLNRRLF